MLQLDWAAPPDFLRGSVDLLCLADCLYEKGAAEVLAGLAGHCLAPGGRLLLADPPRRTPAHRARFVECMAAAGWAAAEEEEETVEELDEDGKRCELVLIEFAFRGGAAAAA